MTNAAGGDPRSPEQIAHEAAFTDISDVLLNLEHTIARTKKAIARARKDGGNSNIELALVDALGELERVHKTLMQGTYYADDSLRLI